MKEFIKVMKALSDPNRVKLLKLIQQREMCVCEIQAALEIAQPTVSKHLKVLEDAGLVEPRKGRPLGELLPERRRPEPLCGKPPGQPEALVERRSADSGSVRKERRPPA